MDGSEESSVGDYLHEDPILRKATASGNEVNADSRVWYSSMVQGMKIHE